VNQVSKNNTPAKKEGPALKERWDKIKEYFIGVYSELKKVHWPSRQQLMVYTGVVLLAVVIVGSVIWLFDMGLSFLLAKLPFKSA
jgi:preprotein translocase subunit SecE